MLRRRFPSDNPPRDYWGQNLRANARRKQASHSGNLQNRDVGSLPRLSEWSLIAALIIAILILISSNRHRLRRLTASLDNGAVITLLSIYGLTHRQACLGIAVAVLVPVTSLAVLITLGTFIGSL